MKKFDKPEVEILLLNEKDVIVTSGPEQGATEHEDPFQ